jgi:hypothetical protein
MSSRAAAALSALLVLLVLSAGCAKSTSSSSTAALQASVDCEVAGKTSDGVHFTMPLTLTPVGPLLAPSLAVTAGSAKGGKITVDKVTVLPVFRPDAKATSTVTGGRVTLPLARGAGGWLAIGSTVPVRVTVHVSTAGASGGSGEGECETTVSIFRRALFCVLKTGETVLRLIVEFTKKEGGWAYKVVDIRGGYRIVVKKTVMYILGNIKLFVAEQIGSAPERRPVPIWRDDERELPFGSTIQINGHTFAGPYKVPRRTVDCSTERIPLDELVP